MIALKTFYCELRDGCRAEDGAVTVDWVVLTACVVGMGAIVGATVWGRTVSVGAKVGTYIGSVTVTTN